MMTRRSKEVSKPALAHVRRNDDGLFAIHDLEDHVRALIQAVKQNHGRFPDDFMFQLSEAEFANVKSQIVTSSWGGLRRAAPYACTEQGVVMLSSMLKICRALQWDNRVATLHNDKKVGQ